MPYVITDGGADQIQKDPVNDQIFKLKELYNKSLPILPGSIPAQEN